MNTEFDATKPQSITLEIEKNGNTYKVGHKLNVLSDDRYFQYAKDLEQSLERDKGVTSQVYKPKLDLWNDLAIERTGYKEREDWKEKTHVNDKIQAIHAYTFVNPVSENAPSTDALLDDDDLTAVKLSSICSGVEVITTHYFRPETKEQVDEYWAIQRNLPQVGVIASAIKKSKSQRFAELHNEIIERTENYVDNIVPAWHKAVAAMIFFDKQLSRLGKY